MVYRKKKLDAHLRNSDNAAFLEKFGYTAGGGSVKIKLRFEKSGPQFFITCFL